MTPISATIITLNEEDRIAGTVRALDFCDEVLVVDSGSQDRTRELAADHGARVLVRPWTGYADQKNFAADQARHDWILNLDADEQPGPGLRGELEAWRASENSDENLSGGFTAWSVPRLTRYEGRWIHHSGWYPDRKVRLYDRRCSRWSGAYVHEHLETTGRVGELAGDLLHSPYRSLADHHERMERYTALAAEEAFRQGRRFSWFRVLGGPPAAFCRSFLFRAGFLDGRPGLRIAYMAARYVYLREVRISR
jgi:glycosyltransferase involved in cell wall biosynthesis